MNFSAENISVGYEDRTIINDLDISIPEGKFRMWKVHSFKELCKTPKAPEGKHYAGWQVNL